MRLKTQLALRKVKELTDKGVELNKACREAGIHPITASRHREALLGRRKASAPSAAPKADNNQRRVAMLYGTPAEIADILSRMESRS